jgi:hypothetical protein
LKWQLLLEHIKTIHEADWNMLGNYKLARQKEGGVTIPYRKVEIKLPYISFHAYSG